MNILVVDDKQSILSMLSEMLETSGYTVNTACNGLDAFEKAQQQSYDLFIIDHLMPIMNGVQLSKNLKQHQLTSTTPIIFMSTQALAGVNALQEARLFDVVIAKPINKDILLAKISQLNIVQPPLNMALKSHHFVNKLSN